MIQPGTETRERPGTREGAPSLAVLVAGYYGAGNLGDELLLELLLDELRERLPTAELRVVSRNPERTAREHRVTSLGFDDFAQLAEAMARSDLFILGGGGLFQDHDPFRAADLYRFPAPSVSAYAQVVLMAEQFDLPVVYWAAGLGPLRSAEARAICRDLLESAPFLSLRDADSLALLRELGVVGPRPVGPDPAWGFRPSRVRGRLSVHRYARSALEERFPELRGRRWLAINVRPWPSGEDWEERLAEGLVEALDESWALVWLPLQEGADEVSSERLRQRIDGLVASLEGRIAQVVLPCLSPEELLEVLGAADRVFAMRLHALILAGLAAATMASFEYDPKVSAAAELLELPSERRLTPRAPSKAMRRAFESLLAASPDREARRVERRVAALREEARVHGELLDQAITHASERQRRGWRRGRLEWLPVWLHRQRQAETERLTDLEEARTESREARNKTRELGERLRRTEEVAKTLAERVTEVEATAAARFEAEVTRRNQDAHALRVELDRQKRAARELAERVELMSQSKMKRLLNRVSVRGGREGLGDVTARAVRLVRSEGPGALVSRVRKKIAKELQTRRHRRALNSIVARSAERPLVVLKPVVDWNIPLFQRPQHIARRLGAAGITYFYATPNAKYDHVSGFIEDAPSCFVTNRFDLLLEGNFRKVLHLYSTDLFARWSFVEERVAKGDLVLYEYIDEIHEDISGHVAPFVREKHQKILESEDIIVIVSAQKLLREVESARSRNFALVTNGVDTEHFDGTRPRGEPPAEIRELVARGKPVIGYFGALAKWFDYELVAKLAGARPDLEILLIGWDYDGTVASSGVEEIANVTRVGPIPYDELPRYARFFDVSTIPFLLNDVTESTSPIKLFEYMALGRPIVTTDMPECRRYESALVARDHDHFIELVGSALDRRQDRDYLAVLAREAAANTWEAKARDIAALVTGAWNAPESRTN